MTQRMQYDRKRGRTRCLVALSTALLALSMGCIDDYNPFSDTANARAYIVSQTIADGDTVAVFSAETLEVMVTLKEHVDSLLVSATSNRTWHDTDSTIGEDAFLREPFPIIVSFYDTGLQSIALTTLKGASVMSSDTISVYVRSPLAQDTVRGSIGGELVLRTEPVADVDVTYRWSFGAGTVVESQSCSTLAEVLIVSPADSGTLWVTDGSYSSPRTSFAFILDDITAPTIACVNAGYTGGDTVFTGNTALNLKLEIVDDGGRQVEDATIDGGPFDDTVNVHQYLKLFPDMQQYPASSPLAVTVRAVDGFGNAAEKRYYLAYDDTLPVVTNRSLALTYPEEDSTSTGIATFTLIGLVESSSDDTEQVVLEIARNDSVVVADTVELQGAATGWYRAVPLVEGGNTLTVRLLSPSLIDTHGVAQCWVEYVPGLADTEPPNLWYVRIGDRKPSNRVFYVPDERVVMRAYATDPGSGLQGIYFDDSLGVRSSGWYYSDTITTLHLPEGVEVVVRAVDNRNNVMQVTYAVVYNRVPVFDIVPPSDYIRGDIAYADSIRAVDADGDDVQFSKNDGPAGMTVSPDGRIAWTPDVADTGVHVVKIRAYDGYQSVYYSYSLYVSDSTSVPPPVRFATRTSDFPSYLVAAEDTMRVTLGVEENTGIAPYRFWARIAGGDGWLMEASLDSQLVWSPGPSLTGTQQLIVIVRDNVASSDTIYPAVMVVPPNRPCSLSVTHGSPATVEGVIDLNARQRTDTLLFHIQDPDSRALERHSIVVRQARSRVISVIDSAVSDSFRVIVDPLAFDGYDTVSAVVEDIAGHRDTLTLRLYYGVPPASPRLLSPSDGQNGVARPVQLVWQGSDPDGDPLTYDIHVGADPSALTPSGTTVDTTTALPGLQSGTTYYWQVFARDWKGSAGSEVFEFRTQ